MAKKKKMTPERVITALAGVRVAMQKLEEEGRTPTLKNIVWKAELLTPGMGRNTIRKILSTPPQELLGLVSSDDEDEEEVL